MAEQNNDRKLPFIDRLFSSPPRWASSLGCLYIALYLILFIPLSPYYLIRWRIRRSRFIKMLTADNRIITWQDFVHRAINKQGTVIIEVANKCDTRFWWTPEIASDLFSGKIPEAESVQVIANPDQDVHPFNLWCYENYTSHITGHAFLAYPVEAVFETFPFDENYRELMIERFTSSEIVIVMFYDARYASALNEFFSRPLNPYAPDS